MAPCNRFPSAWIAASELTSYVKQGIQIVAPPPLWALVALQGNRIVPSQYSLNKGPPVRIGRRTK